MKIFNNLKAKANNVGNAIVEKSKDGLSELDKLKTREERDPFLKDDFYDNGNPIDLEDFGKEGDDDKDKYEVGLPPAQKPASFHHFILENQYEDVEMLIRGYKKVKEKKTQAWRTIKKESHCFTDEEAEKLVRIIQAHLSPDVKLGIIHPDSYKIKMLGLGKRMLGYVRTIMYYQFGRFKESEQLSMKQDAVMIMETVMTRVSINYSRAIKGKENERTHDSVRGQESLQGETQKNTDYSY